MLTVVFVLAGQPALTANAFGLGLQLGVGALPGDGGGCLVRLDWEATLLLLPETRKTIPTITAAMTTTMMPLRICLRRFWL